MTKRPLQATSDGWNNPFAAIPTGNLPDGEFPDPLPARQAKLGRVILRRETAHRGGKTVIVVHEFAPNITGAFIEELAGKLKKSCGCGGTVKDRTIEIQGDQPGKIRSVLEAAGFRADGVR